MLVMQEDTAGITLVSLTVDKRILHCVVEAEQFFAAEDQTLLAIWEFIDEGELDKASEFIEKARQLNNADFVNSMTDAIKLIEALRTLK